jgi:hypothetical protein
MTLNPFVANMLLLKMPSWRNTLWDLPIQVLFIVALAAFLFVFASQRHRRIIVITVLFFGLLGGLAVGMIRKVAEFGRSEQSVIAFLQLPNLLLAGLGGLLLSWIALEASSYIYRLLQPQMWKKTHGNDG